MDFWAENQGHLRHYNKFNTIPTRIRTQNYPDRQLASQFPVYYGDQQQKTINSGYWPSRDIPNWTNQETAGMTSSQNFPFSFGHPIQRHYSDVGEQQRQEARDWAIYQQQQERGMQHEGWSYHPAHCKRDFSKKNENNFRELEAWALRYSHSLPRRRRIEAELRGTRQDNIERCDMQMLNPQESAQWDRASRKQAPNYCQNMPASSTRDAKNKLSYHTKLYSHPPNYNAPPPYSVQLRSVSTLQKSDNPNYKLQQLLKQQEQEVFEKCPSKVETQEQVNKLIVQGRSSNEATKVIEGRKFKLNKKAGGMTIFCLVSRIADTEHESLPVLQNQTEVVQKKSSNTKQPLKQADEVDFKIQTPMKYTRSPYSKLQAIPICKESLCKMSEKNMQRTNEVSAYEKLAVQSKYPLWRRPSCTSNMESDNAPESCSNDTLESNLQDKENYTKSSCKTDKESTQEAKGDAMQMIDTTCVVVKLDVLQEPKMEQVQYLNSEEQSISRQNLGDEAEQNNPANQSLIKQAKDFQISLEQEAKGIDDKDKSEDILAANMTLLSETLEERAKRICGFQDATMTQLKEENLHMGVEVHSMFKGDIGEKELQEVLTMSQNENVQPGEVSIGEDEVAGDAGDYKENRIKEIGEDLDTESKVQSSKMADNEKESDAEEDIGSECEEAVEISHFTDVLNKLPLNQGKMEEKVLPTQHENPLQVKIQNDEGFAEVVEDTETFLVSENNPMETTLNEANIAALSDDSLDFKDKNQNQGEGDLEAENTVKELANSELRQVSDPEPEFCQIDHVSCDNNGAEDIEAIVINSLPHLDSGQVQERPVLEILSESEQNKDKLTENIHEEMYRSKKDEPECEGDENSDKDVDIANSDIEIQGIPEKVYDWQKEGEHDATEDETCSKGQAEATERVQTDNLESNFKDFKQETQRDSTDNLKDLQFGCQEKEEGLHNEENFDKILPRVNARENQNDGQLDVIAPQVELPSKDVEQSQDEEVKEEGRGAQASSADMSHIDKEDNTEYDQENKVCTDASQVLEDISEKADILEKIHKIEVIKNIQVQEMADTLEDVGLSVVDNEEANEPETQKETGLKQQTLVVINKVEVPDSNVQDSDFQHPVSPSCVNEKELFSDEEENDQGRKMYQSTNKDKEVSESSFVCHPDPNMKHHAVIMERCSSSTDHSQQSIPSSSMCDPFEEEEKYPKSLWDAVSRIRKHTAPDSENEEEEVMDNWDRESLADNVVSFDNVLDKGYLNLTEGMQADEFYEDLNAQDDTLSQCSNSSQGSDGTIVDELEEVTNTDLKTISNESQSSDGEEKIGNESHNGEMPKKTCQNEEEFDEEAETPDEIML